jgi:ABC-type spermidine/putrescine transport system permease subunit II
MNSLILAVLSSLLATILGTMAALGIHSMGNGCAEPSCR